VPHAAGNVKKLNLICLTASPLLFCMPAPVWAQTEARPGSADAQPDDSRLQVPSGQAAPADDRVDAPKGAARPGEREVAFSAAQMEYDSNEELVTASGDVRMNSDGNNLRADKVVWNRNKDEVRAEGKVRLVDPEGNITYGDSVVLTDAMKNGVVQNLLLVLADGGRLAADKGERKDGVTILYRAAYTPCAVLSAKGCPKHPTWEITAVRVVDDPARHRIYYKDATFRLFGTKLFSLPWLSHPDGTGDAGSGLLVPTQRYSSLNGLEVALPYYLRLSPTRDITVTPHFYTGVLPMLEGQYRQLTNLGAFQVTGFATSGTWIATDPVNNAIQTQHDGIRAYIEANGRFQLDPYWSITFSGRYVTDRTFLARYNISRDVRLRSLVDAERIGEDTYLSIAGWAFEGLRVTDIAGQQPIAFPAVDARWRLPSPVWNGQLVLQANSLAILRTEGQDTQRAFVAARWDRHRLTPWGQELILTAYARADAYHTDDSAATTTVAYRGTDGWHGRTIEALAAELRWPLVGPLFGGTQYLTPRVQVVASPPTANLAIPNEDARAVDLEDSNLFELNRFPGYDRWEDGARITYGFDWGLDLPGIRIRTNVGQSYRFSDKPSLFPKGTGLTDQFSDIVGRTSVEIGSKLNFIHRFRLDKDNLALRRNEIDAIVGGHRTYFTIGYLKLNRNIDPTIEELFDHEEIRLEGRVQITRFWSIFGSTVVDLTNKKEDPLSVSNGFRPIRHRLGISYDDDCIELGVTWRRDYNTTGDFRKGNTFMFRVALKNLGR
jgi:LPS-assembly protein